MRSSATATRCCINALPLRRSASCGLLGAPRDGYTSRRIARNGFIERSSKQHVTSRAQQRQGFEPLLKNRCCIESPPRPQHGRIQLLEIDADWQVAIAV